MSDPIGTGEDRGGRERRLGWLRGGEWWRPGWGRTDGYGESPGVGLRADLTGKCTRFPAPSFPASPLAADAREGGVAAVPVVVSGRQAVSLLPAAAWGLPGARPLGSLGRTHRLCAPAPRFAALAYRPCAGRAKPPCSHCGSKPGLPFPPARPDSLAGGGPARSPTASFRKKSLGPQGS